MLDDGQTEPSAPEVAATRFVNAIEPLKQPGLILCRDAHAGITNVELDGGGTVGFGDGAKPNRDGTVFGRIFNGVVEEVADHLVERFGIAEDFAAVLAQILQDRDVFAVRDGANGVHHTAQQFGCMERRKAEFFGAEFQPREGEEVSRQPGEPFRIMANDIEEAKIVLLVVKRPVDERFGIALNRSQRGAKLVGHVDDEVAANAFEAIQFRMLRLQLLHSAFEFNAGLIEFLAEDAKIAAGDGGQAGLEVSVGQFARVSDHTAQTPRNSTSQKCRDDYGRQKSQGNALQNPGSNGVDIVIDSLAGHGETQRQTRPGAGLHGNRDVQKVDPDGPAAPRIGPDPALKRRLEFGARQVIFHACGVDL